MNRRMASLFPHIPPFFSDSNPWDVPALLYLFGILGILLPILFLVLEGVFVLRKTGRNYFFGYRTSFSLSSPERWDWANRTLAYVTFVYEPIILIAHVILFSISLAWGWGFLAPLITFVLSLLHLFLLIPYVEIRGRARFKGIPERPLHRPGDKEGGID